MQKKVKKHLLDIMSSLIVLHNKLLESINNEIKQQILENCQQAAIMVGEAIENDMLTDKGIVSMLEDYCEAVFTVSQKEIILYEDIYILTNKASSIMQKVEKITEKYHVVFFPYKAEMWDSLESIWRACSADERCECDVVPIPYFEFDSCEKKWEYRYDGQRFPSYVHCIYYDYYRLEEMLPDIAYIHNPYDNCNYVTSVHPSYYSDELKKYVDKLVYVPYYVTTGFISPEHMLLPVYRNMDFMIVQSEYAKETCKGMYYYDKILPLGSPKLDNVICKCKEGVDIPKEWMCALKGKKILMLNTSIGDLLKHNEILLNKMKYLFDLIKKHDDIALIWRPHPLLEATMRSLRPGLIGMYEAVLDYFASNSIGVLDRTPDISKIVAMADGYIGSSGSSVVNLFAASGKPVFLLNYFFYQPLQEVEKRTIHFIEGYYHNQRVWFISNQCNTLFYIDLGDKKVHMAGNIPGSVRWTTPYSYIAGTEENIFLSPDSALCPVKYDAVTEKFIPFCDVPIEEMHFGKVEIAGKKIFYLPRDKFVLMEYNTETFKWKMHTECIEELWKGVERKEGCSLTCDCAMFDNCLWITTAYNNRLLWYDTLSGDYKVHTVGEASNVYGGIAVEEASVWLAEETEGTVVRWKPQTNDIVCYCMPKQLEIWDGSNGGRYIHSKLLNMGNYIVLTPCFSSCMVKLDKESGKASMLVSEFWENAKSVVNGYSPKFMSSSECTVRIDDAHLIVQRTCDGAMAEVNIREETYKEFYPVVSEEDYDSIVDGDYGFEKIDRKGTFCCMESRLFTLESFISNFSNGNLEEIKDKQLKELSSLAVNLDGTCGEKVHEFMMALIDA